MRADAHRHARIAAIIDLLTIVPLAQVDGARVEALLDAAFGTDRHGRTAYRLREGAAALPHLSFAAVDEAGELVGSLQSWPVELAADDGTVAPLVLVGPVAVRPDRQQAGIGRTLTLRALEALDRAGETASVLVGDPGYYGRFGFTAAATGGWRLPGPVERHRLMARLTDGRRIPADGLLRPRAI